MSSKKFRVFGMCSVGFKSQECETAGVSYICDSQVHRLKSGAIVYTDMNFVATEKMWTLNLKWVNTVNERVCKTKHEASCGLASYT